MANIFDYKFNISGNFDAQIKGMVEKTGEFTAKIEDCNTRFAKMTNVLATLDMASNYVEKFTNAISELSQPMISLDSQMHDLSAIAGVTGENLKLIERYARSSSKAFGTDAATAVEGYKLLLSQLTPELGKCPEALKAMGDNIQLTSKLMGGDGVAAAEVLTTAMNQYGVSLDDPIKASETMARMMNVMAAAGQEGSAELPAIKVALEQCGMAAKAANISFEETNAAIQVLDKAGKKGSEGGVALRNTLAILGQGRFLPKQTQEELAAAGVDVLKLADTSLSLKDRLDMLAPVMNDAALFSKLFGMENANAARALVQGRDELDRLTEAITGTSSAEDQAAIIMDSYAERQARINQKIDDFKISLTQVSGDFTIWVGTVSSALIPLSHLIPLFTGMWKGMLLIKGLNWGGVLTSIKNGLYVARWQAMLMNRELKTGIFTSNGFMINIIRATLAILRFGTVGLLNALKGLGALILSFITGGTASATFAGIASISFTTFKVAATTACRAVSIAIKSIPVIGWVLAAIAALAAIITYFWKTSATFRGILKGIWEIFKKVFGDIGELIGAIFTFDSQKIKAASAKFANYGSQLGKAFNDAYNAEIDAAEQEQKYKPKTEEELLQEQLEAQLNGLQNNPIPPDPTGGTLNGVSPTSTSGGNIKSVTVSVDKLVEKFEIHTTNIQEDISKVKDMVTEALLSALNDVNLAV